MPIWMLSQIPGTSLFLFAFAGLMLIFGLTAYFTERRKERRRKNRRSD